MIFNCKIKLKLMTYMKKIKYKKNTSIQINLFNNKILKLQVILIKLR